MDEEDELRTEIADIENQLAHKRAHIDEQKDDNGYAPRQVWAEYSQWRAKATHALRCKRLDLSRLIAEKRTVNRHLLDKGEEALESGDPDAMAEALRELLFYVRGKSR